MNKTKKCEKKPVMSMLNQLFFFWKSDVVHAKKEIGGKALVQFESNFIPKNNNR